MPGPQGASGVQEHHMGFKLYLAAQSIPEDGEVFLHGSQVLGVGQGLSFRHPGGNPAPLTVPLDLA